MAYLAKLSLLSYFLSYHATIAAPLQPHQSGGAEHIVIINKSAPIPPRIEDLLDRLSLHPQHSDVRRIFNNSAFTGFSANMQHHCLDALSKMTDVSMVEPATDVLGASVGTRPNAPWGLQRISTASTVTGNDHSLDFTYSYNNQNLGSGADIYIVDTGVYTANNIFTNRARMLWSFDGDMRDNDGHGTHVAGTAGGNILGVASNANILGVKALDNNGGGWSSDVVAAIDKVIQYHDARKQVSGFKGSVMSMSLASSGNVAAINSAISAAVTAGVHTVVAAGNDADNACLASPASAGGLHGPAITVGAVDMFARQATFSNYGPCVDVFAPGVSVISAWTGGPNMINTLSGTSMATPHVTGIVAYALARNETLAADPGLMKEWVRSTALYMSNGILLANNGVVADDGEGMVGFEKMAKVAFDDAKEEREVRGAKKGAKVNGK